MGRRKKQKQKTCDTADSNGELQIHSNLQNSSRPNQLKKQLLIKPKKNDTPPTSGCDD